MSWFRKVTSAEEGDFLPLVAAMNYYQKEYEEGVKATKPEQGVRLWEISRELPGHMAFRYNQWQELNAIHEWLEVREEAMIRKAADDLQKNYARTMSTRDAVSLAETDINVLAMRTIRIEVKLMASKFAGITKGLEFLHYQIGHLVKLREAGIEDATI